MMRRNIMFRSLEVLFIIVIIVMTTSSCSFSNKQDMSQKDENSSDSAINSTLVLSAKTDEKENANSLTGPAIDTGEVVKSWEEYEAAKFPLIASIPEKSIYLYGIKEKGTCLYYNNKGHYFDWEYLTPRFILPQMNLSDFDGDGKEELAVVLYVASGTGYSVEDLHVIEVAEEEFLSSEPESKDYLVPNPNYFKDYCYTNYNEQLKKQVKLKTYKKGKKLMADVTVGKKVNTFELYNSKDDIDNENIVFGNIVRFEVRDKKIIGQFALGLVHQSMVSPDFVGELEAEIQYKKGTFTFSNLKFQKNSEI